MRGNVRDIPEVLCSPTFLAKGRRRRQPTPPGPPKTTGTAWHGFRMRETGQERDEREREGNARPSPRRVVSFAVPSPPLSLAAPHPGHALRQLPPPGRRPRAVGVVAFLRPRAGGQVEQEVDVVGRVVVARVLAVVSAAFAWKGEGWGGAGVVSRRVSAPAT